MAIEHIQDLENAGDAFGKINQSFDAVNSAGLIDVHNDSGAEIAANKVVYINGEHANGKPTIALADSSLASSMPGIAITTAVIADGTEDHVKVNGAIYNFNTSAWTAHDVLYVNGSGDLTNVKPTGTNLIQNFAIVTRVHASAGSIFVIGAGRSNDLPNLPEDYAWVGDSNGVAQPVQRELVSPTLAGNQSWMLSTEYFVAPTIAYASANVQANTSGTILFYLLAGTAPVLEWEVTTGSLPSEFTIDTDTGNINYVTTAATSSGSFGITARNPAGDSSEFIVNYEIRLANGISEFTNSESPYPWARITTSSSVDTDIYIKQSFFGRTTSTSDGTMIEDSSSPIWVKANGDSTWNYLLKVTGYSYWLLFIDSTTDPATLANGLSTDINAISLSYDLVAPTSDDFTFEGVTYPSDQSDIHWGSGQKYLSLGNDPTLDGFMSSDNAWSYGFKLVDAIPRDSLGRTMFTREGRNYHAFYIGHNDTYTAQLVGSGSSRTYDSEDVAFPSDGIPAGAYIRVTFTGLTLNLYVNGTLHWSYTPSSYLDSAASSDSLNVLFGKGVDSNTYQSSATYYHSLWQGVIERLWIANGAAVTTDDNGTTYPTGTTHHWALNEATGDTFSAGLGGIDITGL